MPDQNKLMLQVYRWWYKLGKLSIPKASTPVRFGVLGAALFAPIGLYDPALSHPDVEVVAVAARSLKKAQEHAKQHSIPNAYGSYDELLAQSDIDAIYIPLPIALHAEWAIKAMKAGKHVLIEKAMCSTAEEARAINDCMLKTGKVAMEGMHWQFHPAVHVMKSLVDSGKYGKLKACDARLVLPQGMFADDDIRFNFDMGGGACGDLSYVFSATRYFVGEDGKYEVLSAKARKNAKDDRVDDAMVAEFAYTSRDGGESVRCRMEGDLAKPKILGLIPSTMGDILVTLELEKATISISNYICPHYLHSISINDKITGLTTTQKHYNFGPKWGATGEVWWSTYRYQLEAFVDKIRGREPKHWIEMDDAIAMAEMIDDVYEKAGMVKRGIKSD